LSEKTGRSQESGAESGAVDGDSVVLADPDFIHLMAIWATLPHKAKGRILRLVNAAERSCVPERGHQGN